MSRIFRTLPVLMAVLLFGFTAQAQEEGVGITGKGVKAGSAWGSLSTNDDEFSPGSAGGFTAGVFLTYNFSPKLAIQPELLYVAKGAGDEGFLSGAGYNLGYVEVPVLLKYTPSSNRRLIPSVYLGPAVSVLTSAEIYYHGFFTSYEYDVKDGMKNLDFNMVFGGEIAFRSTRSAKLVLDVRYSIGLVNAIDPVEWNASRNAAEEEGDWGPFHWTREDRPMVAEDAYIKNRVFSFMLGLKF